MNPPLSAALASVLGGNTAFAASIAFNVILIGFEVVGLLWLWKYPRLRVFAILAFTWVSLTGFLGLTVALESFFAMRLWCFALFAHLPIVLVLAASLLWHKSRSLAWLGIAIAIAIGAVAVDAFIVEPEWLDVTEQTLEIDGLNEPVRIVIVADLQTDYFGDYQRDALSRCMQAKPDLILLAGDYVQVKSRERWDAVQQSLNSYLQEINFSAPLGAYAVRGNTDFREWQSLFEGLAVTCLPQTKSIDLGPLYLTGLGDINDDRFGDSFRWSLELDRPAADKPHVVLGHAPDYARSENVDGDLLIAGHTHGGQVQLPFIGPLMTASSIPRRWGAGLTQLDENRRLFISRGVGMERGNAPRLRFLCRPELAILNLVPSSNSSTGSAKPETATAERLKEPEE